MGWQEKPDIHMAKYIMSTIGRDEGFNNNVDITSNGKDVGGTSIVFLKHSEFTEEQKNNYSEEQELKDGHSDNNQII